MMESPSVQSIWTVWESDVLTFYKSINVVQNRKDPLITVYMSNVSEEKKSILYSVMHNQPAVYQQFESMLDLTPLMGEWTCDVIDVTLIAF